MPSSITPDTSTADDTAMQALSDAGAFCGECGFEPGDRGCPECERVWGWYVKALREAGWAPRSETLTQAVGEIALRKAAFGYDFRQRVALGDAENHLRRMANLAEGGAQ